MTTNSRDRRAWLAEAFESLVTGVTWTLCVVRWRAMHPLGCLRPIPLCNVGLSSETRSRGIERIVARNRMSKWRSNMPRAANRPMNPVEMLKMDHEKVKALFDEF